MLTYKLYIFKYVICTHRHAYLYYPYMMTYEIVLIYHFNIGFPPVSYSIQALNTVGLWGLGEKIHWD